MVKLLASQARGPGLDSPSRRYDFRDWLSPASKFRYGWSDVNTENNEPTNHNPLLCGKRVTTTNNLTWSLYLLTNSWCWVILRVYLTYTTPLKLHKWLNSCTLNDQSQEKSETLYPHRGLNTLPRNFDSDNLPQSQKGTSLMHATCSKSVRYLTTTTNNKCNRTTYSLRFTS